jgi:transcriptional regulator with XRE-family HTH domain
VNQQEADQRANVTFNASVLRPLMEQEGISSYRMAKAIGCDESLFSKMWRGERFISYEMAQAACRVLGISFAEVFGPQLEAIGLQPMEEVAGASA